MEISDIRRRFRAAIEQAKKLSAERRTRADAASVAYAAFLRDVAIPVFRMFANVAKAEGQPFTIFTPADGVRLVSERHADDYIEMYLDAAQDPPHVMARVNRRRGGDLLTSEQPLRPGSPINSLTDEDVLSLLLAEVGTLTER
jgi:hypothetical protein